MYQYTVTTGSYDDYSVGIILVHKEDLSLSNLKWEWMLGLDPEMKSKDCQTWDLRDKFRDWLISEKGFEQLDTRHVHLADGSTHFSNQLRRLHDLPPFKNSVFRERPELAHLDKDYEEFENSDDET